MAEAIFNREPVIEVTRETIADLKRRAGGSARGRFRICLHHSLQDQIQEMVLVLHRDTYIQPHRHPAGRTESYHIVEGEMTVFHFDEQGRVIRRIEMGTSGPRHTLVYRLAASVWHTVVPRTEYVVYHETFCGPFVKDEVVEYASWSPGEEDADEVVKFQKKVLGF